MQQLSLGHALSPDTIPGQTGNGIKVRAYQESRVAEAVTAMEQGQHPLIEMATGTGKTAVASEIIRRTVYKWPRQLWIVHRIELVHQAWKAIHRATGIEPGLELPKSYSQASDRIVVASKDTIRTSARLKRLEHYEPFQVIYTDEAHHSPGQSYQSIYRAYPDSVRVGFTATPDRLDRKGLSVFTYRTDPYTILNGIDDGWLVPFKAKRVKVTSIDLSGIGTVAGDLNQGQLDAVIRAETSLYGIAKGILDEAGTRPTIAFVTSVDAAERLAEILNRYKPGSARHVDGTTNADTRRDLFRDFGKSYQYLVNVMVATEGTDLPAASCIAMGRPTESSSLFRQMLGRGGRPLPGLDGIGDDSNGRVAWIRSSPKPDCLVLDFVGATGKHSVITVADAIGYDSRDRAAVGTSRSIKRVADQIESGDGTVDVYSALKQERDQEESEVAKRAAVKEKLIGTRSALIAKVTTEAVDAALIGLGGIPDYAESRLGLTQAATPGQTDTMISMGIPVPTVCDRAKARYLITEARNRLGLATEKQLEFVRKHAPAQVSPKLTKVQANRIIGNMIQKWKGGRHGYRHNKNPNGLAG